MRLGDFGVGQPLDDLHGPGRPHASRHRLMQKERRAERGGPIHPATHPGTEQAVAAAQMVIEERERRADGEGVQPQGHLGKFDGHGVFIDAVYAHAADDMAIVELFWVDRPGAFLGIAENPGADVRYRVDQRGFVIAEGHERLRLGDGGDDLIGQVIDEAYEKVTGPHGGVADFEFEQPLGRIDPGEEPNAQVLRLLLRLKLARVDREGLHSGRDQRADRFADDQSDKIVRGVVTARSLPGEDVRPDTDVRAVANDFVFEQAFVDRAELLNAQVAVVDVFAAVRRALEGQSIDDHRPDRVAKAYPGQNTRFVRIEQAAIVGRQSNRPVA